MDKIKQPKKKMSLVKKILIGIGIFFVSLIILSHLFPIDYYKDGIDYYNKQKYSEALHYLRNVSPDDKNYNDAIAKIKEIKPIVDSIEKSSKRTKQAQQDNNKKTSNNSKPNNMPTEQILAILDADTFVDTTDLKVLRIKTLLNDLASMYNEPIDTIANYTSKAQGVLHDRGIKESCLNILEGMRKGGKLDNTPYKDAVILYIMVADYSQ